MNLDFFSLYKGAWIFQGAPHKSFLLSKEESKILLKKGGFLVRNNYDFDTKEKTCSWYILKDSFGGMEELSSNTRNQIRRANNTLNIKIICKNELIAKGYEINLLAHAHYRIKTKPTTKEDFINRINNCGDDYQFWGCFHKESNELIAFAINHIYDKQCNYETFKANPNYLRGYYPMYGLIFEMNRFYLEEMKLLYVNDGFRTITNHSNIQPFLEEKFKFRKAYCKLQINYNWWMGIAVYLLYPFRKFLPILKIKSILNMEAMKKGKL